MEVLATTQMMSCVRLPFFVTNLKLDFVFFEEFKDVNETQITDFKSLQELGDQKMNALIAAVAS